MAPKIKWNENKILKIFYKNDHIRFKFKHVLSAIIIEENFKEKPFEWYQAKMAENIVCVTAVKVYTNHVLWNTNLNMMKYVTSE